MLHDSPGTSFMMRKWQLLEVLLRLARDQFALFVQQLANILTYTELSVGVSATAEPCLVM